MLPDRFNPRALLRRWLMGPSLAQIAGAKALALALEAAARNNPFEHAVRRVSEEVRDRFHGDISREAWRQRGEPSSHPDLIPTPASFRASEQPLS